MKTLKDVLLGSLGTFGYILWYLLSILLIYAPLIFLDLPFLIDLVIIFAVSSVPFWGDIVELIIWIWSIFAVLAGPFDIFAILYFIALAFYIFTKFIPFVISIISILCNRK